MKEENLCMKVDYAREMTARSDASMVNIECWSFARFISAIIDAHLCSSGLECYSVSTEIVPLLTVFL